MVRKIGEYHHSENIREKIKVNTLIAMKRPEVKSKMMGEHMSDEHRKKLSISHRGLVPSKETIDKRSKSLKENAKINPNFGMRGKHHTDIAKKKMSLIAKKKGFGYWSKGKPVWNRGLTKDTDIRMKRVSENLRGKIGWRRGQRHKKETIEKMRKIKIGKHHTEESKRKIGENSKFRAKTNPNFGMRGKHHSDKTKYNLKKKWQDKEFRLQFSIIKLGEKNPNWHGGISFEPYSDNWTEILKTSIRERDRYTCQVCGIRQINKGFSVHHIDYNKENCNPTNLITLCHSCHIKTNGNRKEWVNYFRNQETNQISITVDKTTLLEGHLGGSSTTADTLMEENNG